MSFYRFIRFLIRFFGVIFYRYTIYGKENFPQSGGAILAANHQSYFDPPYVGSSITRQVNYMAKKELFGNPLSKIIFDNLGVFPVNRNEADLRAIKTALKLLSEGKVVGMFPEGTRSKTGEINEGEMGVALLSARAQVPVVPASISGKVKFFGKYEYIPFLSKIQVNIGKPIYPQPEDKKAPKARLKEFTQEIMDRIKEL